MTERQCKELWREELQPVILGNGFAAHLLALRLRLRYGLPSLLCATHRNLADLLFPASFIPLVDAEPRLLCEQLTDLAKQYEDCLLFLIPSTETHHAWLAKHAALLEADYVLVTPEELPHRIPSCLRAE